MDSTIIVIFGSVLLVSFISFTGIFLLSLNEERLRKLLMYLVSFATGAILANVFLNIFPEMAEESTNLHQSFLLVFGGILGSLVIEKIVHWHHCHNLSCPHVEPVGTMMLIGDGAHNITDGILIATAYLVDFRLGIATTAAVILHEIPQEIGDFSVLIHSGFSRERALLWNFISALSAILGAVGVLLLSDSVEGIEQILLPLTAGNFLYIAGSDLIPALHKEERLSRAVLQVLCILAGAILLGVLMAGIDPHAGVDEEHEENGEAIEKVTDMSKRQRTHEQ